MRWAVVLGLVVACRAAPAPAPTVSNRARDDAPVIGPNCTVQGRVVYADTGDGVPGATMVAEGGAGKEDIAITDENGAFSITLTTVKEKLTIYYADATSSHALEGCGVRLKIRLSESNHGAIILW